MDQTQSIEQSDDYQTLIADGINFLETMNRVMGTDRAHEVWLSMKEAMGRDFQMAVFNSMLKGETGHSIRFKIVDPQNTNAVSTIKAIREYTGFGLKEAKDTWDEAKFSGQWTRINYSGAYKPPGQTPGDFKRRIATQLRSFGHLVS